MEEAELVRKYESFNNEIMLNKINNSRGAKKIILCTKELYIDYCIFSIKIACMAMSLKYKHPQLSVTNMKSSQQFKRILIPDNN